MSHHSDKLDKCLQTHIQCLVSVNMMSTCKIENYSIQFFLIKTTTGYLGFLKSVLTSPFLTQAAQQGHSQIVNLLLDANASPNTVSNNGQTALSIAQKLGYISVVENLRVVTDTVVTTTTTTTTEEKYKVLFPESMQETFMSDSEDEGGNFLG